MPVLNSHACVRALLLQVRRVLDQIRGRSYEEAIMILEYMPYKVHLWSVNRAACARAAALCVLVWQHACGPWNCCSHAAAGLAAAPHLGRQCAAAARQAALAAYPHVQHMRNSQTARSTRAKACHCTHRDCFASRLEDAAAGWLRPHRQLL